MELPEVSVTSKKTKSMGPIGTAALGIGTSFVEGIGNQIFGEMNQRRELRGLDKSLEIQNRHAMEMWKNTSYAAQKEQMQKAGLNPALLYGMSGGGGQTTGGSGVAVGGNGMGIDIQGGLKGAMELALLKAQKDNIEADTKKKLTDVGVGEKEIEGKKFDNLVKEILWWKEDADFEDYYAAESYVDENGQKWYTGDNENRVARRQRNLMENKAAVGTATNLLEQFKNGNLRKMSQAELDSKLEGIGVQKGQVKKLELENALLEMDKKLAESFGMGRDSKGWVDMGLKVLFTLIDMGLGS